MGAPKTPMRMDIPTTPPITAPPSPRWRPVHGARGWWPSVRAGLWVVLLFAVGLVLVQAWQGPLRGWLQGHERLGALVFVATSALAVLAPMLTNLPLVPLAVLAWGPLPTAAMLLGGWLIGAAAAFAIGRHARGPLLRAMPSVMRHAQVERLIHPRHRLLSLVLLRMTFPVDVLSYALGLFSPRTGAWHNLVSTALGAAPFALLFAAFPALPSSTQGWLFAACTLVFVAYAAWVLRDPPVSSANAAEASRACCESAREVSTTGTRAPSTSPAQSPPPM